MAVLSRVVVVPLPGCAAVNSKSCGSSAGRGRGATGAGRGIACRRRRRGRETQPEPERAFQGSLLRARGRNSIVGAGGLRATVSSSAGRGAGRRRPVGPGARGRWVTPPCSAASPFDERHFRLGSVGALASSFAGTAARRGARRGVSACFSASSIRPIVAFLLGDSTHVRRHKQAARRINFARGDRRR